MVLPEFYPEKQGRPDSIIALDMEKRRPVISYGQLSTVINQVLEDELVEQLDDVIDVLEKLLLEAKQAKLHLASMSDQTVEASDVDEEAEE